MSNAKYVYFREVRSVQEQIQKHGNLKIKRLVTGKQQQNMNGVYFVSEILKYLLSGV